MGISQECRSAVKGLRSIVDRYDADPFSAIAYDANSDMRVIRDCARLAEELLQEIDRMPPQESSR